MEDLSFLTDMMLNFSLMSDIEFIFAHGKVVILDFSLCLRSVCRDKILFVNLAKWLPESITNDVPVSDLLVNSRIEDKGTVSH